MNESASIQSQGQCERCADDATSYYFIDLINFDTGFTEHKRHAVCMRHKQEYIEWTERDRENQIRERYAEYTAWCQKCHYEPSSLETWTAEGRYKEW